MLTYILRRLLLMIPTLIGITLLVFMLIALAPGGLGAALTQQSGSGEAEATGAAQQEAYLQDRYGLDQPVIVQYFRWLGRISPIKFGPRDQIDPTGERLTPARAPVSPTLTKWLDREPADTPPAKPITWPTLEEVAADEGIDLSATGAAEQAEQALARRKSRTYRRATQEYARERFDYIGARAAFEVAVADYAAEIGLDHGVKPDGDLRLSVLQRHTPDTSAQTWPDVERLGNAMIDAYEASESARASLRAVFDAKPYREAGIPIIPEVISLSSPDWGRSFVKGRPVADLIASHLPVTLLLNAVATVLIYAIAVPNGMLAAARRGGTFDTFSGALFIALWSFPIPLAGVLGIGFLASKEYLGGFPTSGLTDRAVDFMPFLPGPVEPGGPWVRGALLDTMWHLCLPVACLVYGGFAVLSKQTRAAMLDNFNADYVRTAKAKGVATKDILLRHVFRNSLLPLITMFATVLPAMLAGSVVIESIFTINGMGRLTLEAINLRDRELLLGTTFMISAVNLLALLLADVLYAAADPRITFK